MKELINEDTDCIEINIANCPLSRAGENSGVCPRCWAIGTDVNAADCMEQRDTNTRGSTREMAKQ